MPRDAAMEVKWPSMDANAARRFPRRTYNSLILLIGLVGCAQKQRVTPIAPILGNTDLPPYGQVHANPYLNGISGVDVKIDRPKFAEPLELPRPTQWQKAWS